MQDFTYNLFIPVIIPSKVFNNLRRQSFAPKKSFKALIFIFKVRGVCKPRNYIQERSTQIYANCVRTVVCGRNVNKPKQK